MAKTDLQCPCYWIDPANPAIETLRAFGMDIRDPLKAIPDVLNTISNQPISDFKRN